MFVVVLVFLVLHAAELEQIMPIATCQSDGSSRLCIMSMLVHAVTGTVYSTGASSMSDFSPDFRRTKLALTQLTPGGCMHKGV